MKLSKISIAVLFLNTYLNPLVAQEDLKSDPLLSYTHFYELSLSLGLNRINTNEANFSSDGVDYSLAKNRFLPASDAHFLWGWILKDKEKKEVYRIKTGFGIMSRSAELSDDKDNELFFETGYFQLPLIFSFSEPITYQKKDGRFHKAIDFGIGMYAASPLSQVLRSRNDLDQRAENLSFNYLRYGFMADIGMRFLDQDGKGHKLGIRTSLDLSSFTKFSSTELDIYPVYYMIGVYYNLQNEYSKK